MKEGSRTMKISSAYVAALFLLACSFGWAQTASPDAPRHRRHTRPPYSGPKELMGQKPNLPHRPKPVGKPGSRPVRKSDHIIVR
jgi:hypothetical protein